VGGSVGIVTSSVFIPGVSSGLLSPLGRVATDCLRLQLPLVI